MNSSFHFAFGTHPQHGLVAAALSPAVPPHLAHWLLTHEQFEPVPGTPGLFRLTEPERDGLRRARQAIQDLRRTGYTVHADYVTAPVDPRIAFADRRSRLVQAATRRSTQHHTAPTTALPSGRPVPPKPTYAPTVHQPTGRTR
ncbi:hypothetical protein J7I94_02070 [Streptomyces sp. ISL-12]|uniref:hypothetical protein n=1 Tax=Streptomyces sp. ISL-12 TaxID=2819177 RepID=UPI001BE61A1A|nr:hypothetical protein [Streptomyces sp. ISL-12]MBT2409358.1 hypothetical protein [Streptomyces sp. ISL-12]